MEGPEAIRRGPTKVPRWVWAGAIATILLLCGIFISIPEFRSWRKQPAPTPSPLADLLIESEPSGADLTLDGGPPVRTPHTFKDLKFGPHRLTMTLDGYSPVERGIEFGADQFEIVGRLVHGFILARPPLCPQMEVPRPEQSLMRRTPSPQLSPRP